MTAPAERIIPTPDSPTVATYTISSEGSQLGPEVNVLSIVVDREINRVPTATLIIRDGVPGGQTFPVSDSGVFDPGNRIEISLGYRASNVPVFSGMVTGQRIKVREQRSVLLVTVKDPTYQLTITRRSRYFTDQTDSDAWESILSEAGFRTDGEATAAVVPELTQYRSTDWDFIISRVEANGLVLLATGDNEVTIGEPAVGRSGVLKLEFRANLLSFDAATDLRNQFGDAAATAWSPADGEAITETATASDGVEGTDDHYHGGSPEAPELTAWATALGRRSQLARVIATAEYRGSEAAKVGDTVELSGLGNRFNGLAYVSGLRHELADGRWRSIAQLGIDPEWFTERVAVSAPPAGGLLPAVCGLQVATVLRVHDDPAGEERILVSTPAFSPEGEGNWARLATAVGGANVGSSYRPAVNDEVVVGFLDDDPRHPVILAALHGSRSPAPLPPTEENDRSGYLSRGENKLIFDDTERSVVIESTDGDRLHLLGKDQRIELTDQTGNSIILSSSGIEISSKKDLTLSANGKVEINGMSVAAKGQSAGKFESGGNLTLRGALVQIN